MKTQLSGKDWQILSEYLDEQLSAAERVRLEQRLRSQVELRNGLDELRRTRAVLRATPRRKVPHNFTLTHAMVAEAVRRPSRSGWFTAMSFTSALAALMFVLVLFLQNASLTQSTAALPAAAPVMEKAVQQSAGAANDQAFGAPAWGAPEAGAEASATPMILLWGQPDYGQPQAKGLGGGSSDDTNGALFMQETVPSAAAEGAAAGAVPPAEPDTAQQIQEPPSAGALSAPLAATQAPAEPEPTQATPAATQAEGEVQKAESSTVAQIAETPATTLVPDMLATPLTGNGPIVGVAPEDQRGMMAVTESQNPAQMAQSSRRAPLDTAWTWIETILGAVALSAGGAAVWLRRRSRG